MTVFNRRKASYKWGLMCLALSGIMVGVTILYLVLSHVTFSDYISFNYNSYLLYFSYIIIIVVSAPLGLVQCLFAYYYENKAT